MNLTNLTVGLNDSSVYFQTLIDFGYSYIILIIGITGFITQLLCILVFVKKEMLSVGTLNIYLFLYSLSITSGPLVCIIISRTRCGIFCEEYNTFISKKIEIFSFQLMGNGLYFNVTLLQLIISLHQYLSVIQRVRRFFGIESL